MGRDCPSILTVCEDDVLGGRKGGAHGDKCGPQKDEEPESGLFRELEGNRG